MNWRLWLALALRLLGITGLIEHWQAEQVGEQKQKDADLKAQNEILRKELDVAAHYPSDEEEIKTMQEGRF